MKLLSVEHGFCVELERIGDRGERGVQHQRDDLLACLAAGRRQDHRPVFDHQRVETEILQRGRRRAASRTSVARFSGGLRLWHGDHGIDQRHFGHFDLAAEKFSERKAELERLGSRYFGNGP